MSRIRINRRAFLKATAAGAAAAGFGCTQARTAPAEGAAEKPVRPMNILFINFEDFTPNAIGCYGNPIPKTPNIDRLAASAVRFDHAHIQYPCCNPSRSSFMTGLRPPTTGVLSNSVNMAETLPPGTLTLPEILKAAGYTTAVVGKFFHTLEFAEKHLRAFDRIEFYQKPAGWEGPPPILQFPPSRPAGGAWPGGKAPAKTDPEYAKFKKWSSDRYGDSGRTLEQEPDYRYCRTGAALLEELAKGDQPFFLAVGSQRPHTPLLAPKQFLDMYPPEHIPDPPAQPDQCRDIPDVAHKFGRSSDIFMDRRASPDEARRAIAAYYACASMVDAGVGVLLDALDRTGLAASTIVVFLGDHGFHLGEHGLWSKYTLFESSTRAPLIVRVPGAKGNGRPCPRLVEFVDLVPTLCDLAGAAAPANVEGTSFRPLLNDPARAWKKGAYTWFGNKGEHRSVRSERYRYAEWQHKGQTYREFYDLQADPWETTNRVDDPALAAQVAEHKRLLDGGWKAALPS